MLANIKKSVGSYESGAANDSTDIRTVQELLQKVSVKLGQPSFNPGTPDGKIHRNGNLSKTVKAIEAFQRQKVGYSQPDRRMDPNGKTWKALVANSGGAAPVPATNSPGTSTVVYGNDLQAEQKIVSDYSFKVLEMVMANAGCTKGVITSTIRTPEKQANIMYDNAKVNLAKQYGLYKANGQEVLKVYEANMSKPKSTVVALMVAKINELAKSNKRVSLHVVPVDVYKSLNIIDLGVNSTRAAAGSSFDKNKITAAFQTATRDGYIRNFIDETAKSNNCWHVEIAPHAKPLPT